MITLKDTANLPYLTAPRTKLRPDCGWGRNLEEVKCDNCTARRAPSSPPPSSSICRGGGGGGGGGGVEGGGGGWRGGGGGGGVPVCTAVTMYVNRVVISRLFLDVQEFLLHFGYLAENHDMWRHFRLSRKKAVRSVFAP